MIKTIFYFHGFASSSQSDKAKLFKKYISSKRNIEILVPDLNNNFEDAINEINNLINSNIKPMAFVGSSLGGYYAAYFSSLHKTKAILINPAIPPLSGFDIYLGENENYSTGEKFNLTKADINFIRSFSYKKYPNKENTLVFLESGDEVLNYIETCSYFMGSTIDITFGGSHSYESLNKNLKKIGKFLEIS